MKRTKFPAQLKKQISNEEFEKVNNLIRKIAWSFHSSTGIEYEELYSESCLGYLEGISHFTEELSTTSTFIYHIVSNKLKTYISKQKSYKMLQYLDSMDDLPVTYNPSFFFEIADQFNENGKFILKLMMDNKYVLSTLPPSRARGEIVKLLRKHRWSWPRIWREIKEVKTTLNSI